MNSHSASPLAALFLAVALLSACGSNSRPPTAAPAGLVSVVSSPTAATIPTAIPTAKTSRVVKEWRLGPPVTLGAGIDELNISLYMEQGCASCDGPPTALERAYRDNTGVLRREPLFTTPVGSKYMTSAAVAADGTLYATACFGGCYEVGSGIDGMGHSVLYVSKDEGRTWNAQPPTAQARKVWDIGALPNGSILLWGHRTQDGAAFELFPSGESLAPPIANTFPVITADPNEPIVWQPQRGGGAIYRPDGAQVAIPAVGASENYVPYVSGAQPAGGLTLTWGEAAGGESRQHLGIIQAGAMVTELAASKAVPAVQIGAWLDDHRALGNVNYSTPALFDFPSGEVRLIELGSRPQDDPRGPGRNRVIGFGAVP